MIPKTNPMNRHTLRLLGVLSWCDQKETGLCDHAGVLRDQPQLPGLHAVAGVLALGRGHGRNVHARLGIFPLLLESRLDLRARQHFPFFVTYRGAGIPLSELLGYLTTATTFQGLMLLFIRKFGKIVIKDYALVPFSRRP